MSTSVLNKLKTKINDSIASKFSLTELMKYKFIPVDVQGDTIYIVVSNDFDTQSATSFILSIFVHLSIKKIKISPEEYNELFEYYKHKYVKQADVIDAPSGQRMGHISYVGNRMGDILVRNKIITKKQLLDAVKVSQEQGVLLGEVLVSQGLVSPTLLKQIVEKQEYTVVKDGIKKKLGELLLEAKMISPEQLREALALSEKHAMLLGDVLVHQKIITPEELSAFLEKQKNSPKDQPKKRLGEMLIDKGFITQEQLEKALEESKTQNIPIGSMLVKLNMINISQLKECLSEQQGTEVIETTSLKLDPRLLNILPEDFIRENQVIPIRQNAQVLVVGMVHPNNKKVLNDIIYLTGQKVRALVITYFEFESCINMYYNRKSSNTGDIIKMVKKEISNVDVEETLFEQVERELSDESGIVAKFAKKIITDAIDQHASDIHIEPRLNGYVVRYRMDGILKEVFELPPRSEQAILTRFKVLSKMNIAEHRRAQDGTFTSTYGDREFDFRINTLPVAGKEKMVIRVLAPAVSLNAADKDIKLAGGTEEDIEIIKKMVSAPNGIILTTGPTGSGKTTTLYSILKSLNDEKVNITTIEDPVEIKIDGINQSQINNKAGITFASSMRAILRQDPDIILVGEIRDYETLETAISAALTGHLVLSTIHTNSAAATVSRLIEMGAKGYLVASTVTGIIAQRLVRKLCPLCKAKYRATEEEARKVVIGDDEVKKFMARDIYKPVGCVNCDFNGYVGRMGVYEILMMNKELKKLIADGVHDIKIEEIAVSMGMKTLQQSCLNHIINGQTTVSEFIRVLGPVTE